MAQVEAKCRDAFLESGGAWMVAALMIVVAAWGLGMRLLLN